MREQHITVWRFDDAPEEYRNLSTHGGDEDWVIFVPQELVGSATALDLELDTGDTWEWKRWARVWGWLRHYEVEGGVVFIAAHA